MQAVNERALRTLALVSGVYDLALALPCCSRRRHGARSSGRRRRAGAQRAAQRRLHPDPGRRVLLGRADVEARRGYFWVAGVLAKGLGAALFVADHFLRGSPASFLLFAATDGTLALVTAGPAPARAGSLERRPRAQYSSSSMRCRQLDRRGRRFGRARERPRDRAASGRRTALRARSRRPRPRTRRGAGAQRAAGSRGRRDRGAARRVHDLLGTARLRPAPRARTRSARAAAAAAGGRARGRAAARAAPAAADAGRGRAGAAGRRDAGRCELTSRRLQLRARVCLQRPGSASCAGRSARALLRLRARADLPASSAQELRPRSLARRTPRSRCAAALAPRARRPRASRHAGERGGRLGAGAARLAAPSAVAHRRAARAARGRTSRRSPAGGSRGRPRRAPRSGAARAGSPGATARSRAPREPLEVRRGAAAPRGRRRGQRRASDDGGEDASGARRTARGAWLTSSARPGARGP